MDGLLYLGPPKKGILAPVDLPLELEDAVKCHLVGDRSGDNLAIGLARAGTEDYTKVIEVITRGACMHHIHGTAGEAEGRRGLAEGVGVAGDPAVADKDAAHAICAGTTARRAVRGRRAVAANRFSVKTALHTPDNSDAK
ncbi:hypothetical protein GW17_00001303 [Ensete ventricosum]|nr:hypothetical protein GW17_00001303 [Ensete ventricosum]